jgi:hypothetical protein
MPVCCICQADGVMSINGDWFCVEHVDEAFLLVGRMLAQLRGWNVDEINDALMGWLEEE